MNRKGIMPLNQISTGKGKNIPDESGNSAKKIVDLVRMKHRIFHRLTLNAISVFMAYLVFFPAIYAQKLDVAYVPTPDSVVERMLDMARVGPGDYVIDLGCGDGRINIAAAKRGAFGHGVDLDPKRIKEARKNAQKAGMADKVVFLEENIYETDFSRATVIAMYLFPNINLKLRPKLLENLEPGTRIVSHDFGMDEWKPDKKHGRMDEHAVLLWIVPAKVEGQWSWETAGKDFQMSVNQKFQKITPTIMLEQKTPLKVENSLLSGKRINFSAFDKENKRKFVFSGHVENGEIKGIVQIHDGKSQSVESWSARLN